MTLTAQTRWDRHRGDQDDTLELFLDGINVLPITTVVKAWVARNLAPPVELTATIQDVTTRRVLVQLGGAGGWLETAAIGTWRFVVTCEFLGGTGPITFPERGHAELRIHGPV